jgi:hypothetical protein
MSRLWPTLHDIARGMRAELARRPGRPGERAYRHSRLHVELVLWYDGDEVWKLTVKRPEEPPEPHAVAFARAAFGVPDEADIREFKNRREPSPKGHTLTYQGLDLIWREVVV